MHDVLKNKMQKP